MVAPHIHSWLFPACKPVGPSSLATAWWCYMQVRWCSTNMSDTCWATPARVHCDVNVPPLFHISPGPARSIQRRLFLQAEKWSSSHGFWKGFGTMLGCLPPNPHKRNVFLFILAMANQNNYKIQPWVLQRLFVFGGVCFASIDPTCQRVI